MTARPAGCNIDLKTEISASRLAAGERKKVWEWATRMAESIRTRASRKVDLISGMGEGLGDRGSEQVMIVPHILRKGEGGKGRGQDR